MVNGIEAAKLLQEMQRLAGSAQSDAAAPAERYGFAELLQRSIASVNEAQTTAQDMAAALERGVPGVGLPEVMIALQKASVSFQAMTEVRNRLVTAYQEIMNMPI